MLLEIIRDMSAEHPRRGFMAFWPGARLREDRFSGVWSSGAGASARNKAR